MATPLLPSYGHSSLPLPPVPSSSSPSISLPLVSSTLPSHRQSSSSHDVSQHGHSHGMGAPHSHSHSTSHAHSHSTPHPPSDKSHHPTHHRPSPSLSLSLPFLLSLFSSPDTTSLSLYTSVKLLYTLLLFLVGVVTSSPTLTSLSFHTLFSSTALSFSLYAMVLSRSSHPSSAYSYGMARHQLVAAFTNAIFLFFVSTFMVMELFHALVKGVEGGGEGEGGGGGGGVGWEVWVGLLVDVVGLALFSRWSTAGSAKDSRDLNCHSVFLFASSDVLQHLLALLSAALPVLSSSHALQPLHLQALSYLITSVLVLYLTLPLFSVTSQVLLHQTPPHLRAQLERLLREISFHDGVLECRDAHFWQVSVGGPVVGSVHVRVRAGVDEEAVGREIRAMLGKWVQEVTVQVEKDTAPAWMHQPME